MTTVLGMWAIELRRQAPDRGALASGLHSLSTGLHLLPPDLHAFSIALHKLPSDPAPA